MKKGFIEWFIEILAVGLFHLTHSLIRIRVVGKKRLEGLTESTPVLYAVWHRFLWIFIYYFRHQGLFTLASLSQDGEYITRVLERLGWNVIRGSSSKGGSRSLIKLYKQLEKGARVLITTDGPKGPRYQVKPGIVFLQEKSEGVIVPLGFAVRWKKVFNSWDRFVFPLPLTRVVVAYGEPIALSSELSIEERCRLLEEELFQVEEEARSYLDHEG